MTTLETPGPERLRMSGPHLVALVSGVLAIAVAHPLWRDLDVPWWALAALAAGITLILVGADGLGRSIRSTPLTREGYPTQLEGRLDPTLSRAMWLVKWLLAVPHFVVLAFLWAAFPVAVPAAAVMILVTGRYPVGLFEFVVGVLRWNWCVVFYAVGVLGTDRYPPFTLARTDYPATFDVAYPERLSRGKVLVKSWLLAFPHLLIVGVLAGVAWGFSESPATGGLVGLLAFVAVVILFVTKRYESGLFDLIMGIQRWIHRVYAYTALLRDDYPPFRLDQGPLETRLSPEGAR